MFFIENSLHLICKNINLITNSLQLFGKLPRPDFQSSKHEPAIADGVLPSVEELVKFLFLSCQVLDIVLFY